MTPRATLFLLALLVAVPSACLRLRAPGDTSAYRLAPLGGARCSPPSADGVWVVTGFEGGALRIDLKPQRGRRMSARPTVERAGP